MSGKKVVDLEDARAARTPHLAGMAKCLSCGHTQMSVVPVGTLWLECSECALSMARMVAAVERDGLHRHCECGNDLFYIHESGPYCARCGVEVPE